jgi:hypothetical protein
MLCIVAGDCKRFSWSVGRRAVGGPPGQSPLYLFQNEEIQRKVAEYPFDGVRRYWVFSDDGMATWCYYWRKILSIIYRALFGENIFQSSTGVGEKAIKKVG